MDRPQTAPAKKTSAIASGPTAPRQKCRPFAASHSILQRGRSSPRTSLAILTAWNIASQRFRRCQGDADCLIVLKCFATTWFLFCLFFHPTAVASMPTSQFLLHLRPNFDFLASLLYPRSKTLKLEGLGTPTTPSRGAAG